MARPTFRPTVSEETVLFTDDTFAGALTDPAQGSNSALITTGRQSTPIFQSTREIRNELRRDRRQHVTLY